MKKISSLFFLLTLACSQLCAVDSAPAPKPIKFSIHEKAYRFSNTFELSEDEAPMGVVTKKRFAYGNLADHYHVYDAAGKLEGYGRKRALLSLGALFSWATEIDVKDASGVKIGMIDGQAWTTASARFSLYDYDATGRWTLKGIAFMDRERKSFSIVDPTNDKRIIAVLRRVFVPNTQDHWECKIFYPDAMNLINLKVFATFAVDHQEFFRADN